MSATVNECNGDFASTMPTKWGHYMSAVPKTVKLSVMAEQEASLLPESEWPTCSRCHMKIPQFQMSSELRDRLFNLLAQGHRAESVAVIRNKSGCNTPTAKAWVVHEGLECFSGETPLCPYCGKTLRTPRAKQCRFCGRDWHCHH